MANPRFSWGIDVGNRALKAIRLVRDGDQLRIDDFEVIEHEQILSQAGDNREALIQTSLVNFAQRHPFKGGSVAIGVSGQASFARFIKLPPVDPTKITEIVQFEAIQQIPFPLDEVEWSYQLFQAPDSPEVEVGIFAMKRELVNQTIKYFADVGLQVTHVQMNPLADYNGMQYDGRLEGTSMIIDIGAENSDLIISDGENIWMRSIPIGGNSFTEALVKNFKLKFGKAEELKRNAANSKYGRQILQAMKPVFGDLVSEIQRSIGFYASTHPQSRIGRVLALGGTFHLPGLLKYLQQNLQLEVVRVNQLNAPTPSDARFAAAFNDNILSAIGAYGLALQGMGVGKMTSSLLPAKIKRERMWKSKTRWFALAATMFVAGTAIPLARLYADKAQYEAQGPAQKEIGDWTKTAIDYDKQWKDVQTSGEQDRAMVAGYKSLWTGREFGASLAEEIGRAIPAPNPADDAKQRTDRQTVELIGWTMRYEPNLTVSLNLKDDEFNLLADHLDLNSSAMTAVSSDIGLPSFMAGQSTGPGPHGFLVTIVCKTMTGNPAPLVFDTVVKELRGRNTLAANPPRHLSFERVTIPSKIKVSAAYPNGLLHAVRGPVVFTPPIDASRPEDRNLSVTPYSTPQRPMDVGQEQYPDPYHKGESMKDDSLVTVLAAVVIDPPPAAKPAPPAPGPAAPPKK